MSNKKGITIGVASLSSVLTIIFVCCKLFEVIDWSWWWVFSPLWIELAIGVAVVVIALLFYIIMGIIGEYT